MLPISPLRRRSPASFGAAFVLGLAWVAAGASDPARADGTVSAQAQTLAPCTLITVDDVEPLADASVAEGVAMSSPVSGNASCRYVWGAGAGRFTLNVTVDDAAKMFSGLTPEQIKQRLLESVRAGTADAVIPEVGDVAVFKPDSPVYASAVALVKGRILMVHLDGAFARERKDQVIGLLKSAAARL